MLSGAQLAPLMRVIQQNEGAGLLELSHITQQSFGTIRYRIETLRKLGLVDLLKAGKYKFVWSTEPVLGDLVKAIDFRIKEENNAKRIKRFPALHPDRTRQIRELAGI